MSEWIDTNKRLPASEDRNGSCATYYTIRVPFNGEQRAMFLDGQWSPDYISVLVVPVTHWLDDTDD